jgi:hypothetical protein
MTMTKTFRAIVLIIAFLLLSSTALASFSYHIPFQEDVLTVQKDGTVILDKMFEFHVDSSSTDDGTLIWAGLPTKGTKVNSVQYWTGDKWTDIPFTQKSRNGYVVELEGFPPIKPGNAARFNVKASISDLIFWSDKDSGLISISYIPAWWDSKVNKLIFTMEFEEDIKDLTFPRTAAVIDKNQARTKLTWDYSNLAPGQKLEHAVIFSAEYFHTGVEARKPSSVLPIIGAVVGGVFLLGLGLATLVRVAVRGASYQTPLAYIKGNEACRSLDPVEVGMFFNSTPNFIVRLIVIGLIEKGILEYKEGRLLKHPTLERLKYYEERFLDSIDSEVEIVESKWKENYVRILEDFKERLTGYCGQKTKEHYLKVLKSDLEYTEEDPRWKLLQYQLAHGNLDRLSKDKAEEVLPSNVMLYYPIFNHIFLSAALDKEGRKTYASVFPYSAAGGHGSGGSGCACACACACAGGGGCT